MFRHGKIVVGKLQVGGGNTDRSADEPVYEEVGPPRHLKKKNIQNGSNIQGVGRGGGAPARATVKNCDLCGSTEAAVRCERCQSQAFCLACDEMYHKHPRRASHIRKSVESSPNINVRPPLPPKVDTQGVPPPQPPPRKNKGRGFMPAMNNKEQGTDGNSGGGRSIMGSLKRFMGSRPLPPVPDQAKGRSTPAPPPSGPSPNSMGRRNTSPNINFNNGGEEGVVSVSMSGRPVPALQAPPAVVAPSNGKPTADPNSQYAQANKQQHPQPPQHHNTNSLGRKFSLQQNNPSLSTSRSSMVEAGTGGGGGGWETDSATRSTSISNLRQKSQSISDDQWAAVMATQDGGGNQGWGGPVAGFPEQGQQGPRGGRCNTLGGRSAGGQPQPRGMVSSASVCDLNTLSQQQQPPQQHNFANPHMAGSFQHLNMMGMMPWGGPPPPPSSCDLCQGAPMNYPGHQHCGMKRAGSNVSMNLSSVGSNEMPGYPWPPPAHMHQHMPIAYPGYYPGYLPQMVPPPGSISSSTGLNVSIPESMHTFGKVPSSPQLSQRSSSHRSHKSSKSRSFSAADNRHRSYNKKRSEESEDSYSSSYSDEDEINERVSKTGYRTGGTLSWQCDHCTFINSGGTRTCGMCSKTQGSGKNSSNRSKSRNNDRNDRNDRSQRKESRKYGSRRTDHDDDPDVSDYDNDEVLKSNISFHIRDNRKESRSKSTASNKTKTKKKSRRSVGRSQAGSPDSSPLVSEEEVQLERQMKDLRVSSSRKQNGNYDGYTEREKERSSQKKEGGNGRFKNRGRASSERCRTPARQISKQTSPEQSDDDQLHEPQVAERDMQDTERRDSPKYHPGVIKGEIQSQQSSHEDTLQNEQANIVKNYEAQTVSNIAVEDKHIITKPQRPTSLQLPMLESNTLNFLIKDESTKLVNENSLSPNLHSPKIESPIHSNRTSRDADEPSFANTLDEITSMGTEVVDYIPSSKYTDPDMNLNNVNNINEIKDDTPVAYFVSHEIQNDQIANLKVDAVEMIPSDPVDNTNKNIQEEIPEVILEKPEENKEVINLNPIMDQDPSYELIDDPKPKNEGTLLEEATNILQMVMEMSNNEVDKVIEVVKPEGAERNNEQSMEELRETSREGSRELVPTPSSSIDSLPADHEHYTPLSCSSSDAQFYSPPDSPDVEDKPSGSQTQDSSTIHGSSSVGDGGGPDEDLVTALESVHSNRDNDTLAASRETIRDSVEQLPYSEEVVVADDARPSSTGAEVPAINPLLSPITPTDGYESLSFQDAVSETHQLQRSLSDKGIASTSKVVPSRYSVAPSEEEITALQQARQAAFSQELGQAVGSKQLMTVEDIIKKRKQDSMQKEGLEVVRQLREAEASGYTAEDVSIAMNQCGDKDPVEWLKENWRHMVDTVITLATNYEQQRQTSDVDAIGIEEASSALRLQKGNIWEAVTECLNKRNKVDDLQNLVIGNEHLPTTSNADNNKKDMLLSDADEPSDELAALHQAGAEEDAVIDKNEEIIKLQQNDGINSEREDEVYYENNEMKSMTEAYYDSVSIKDVEVPKNTADSATGKSVENNELTVSPALKLASAIVGQAIAKSMARETSVRLSASRSVTPDMTSSTSSRDPTSSSRDPTPLSRDPTPDHLTVTTPDPITEEDTTLQVTVTDSEDDDLLRTLDTIPEEEEISAMTDTGRLSRSSTGNLMRIKKAGQNTTNEGSTVIPQEANTSATLPILETPVEESNIITSLPVHNIDIAMAGVSSNEPHISNSNISQTISSPSVGGAYSILRVGSSNALKSTETTSDGTAGDTGRGAINLDYSSHDTKAETSTGDSDGEAVSRRMIPGLLGQVEGLKAKGDGADYAEVLELKEQITSMRKHLEEQMQQGEETEEEDGARPSSGATTTTDDEQQQPTPTITVQQPNQDENPPQEETKLFDFDRTVRRLLAEGQSASYEKAELAVQLMTFNFDEKDSIYAAEECSSIYTAIKYLQQECELCAEKYPMGKMVSMLMCTHSCCTECAKTYFTFQIKTKNIREVRCPFCNEPDLDADEDAANGYLNNLDILLKNILDDETHGLFQRKLRDWALMKDPNFKWCSKCSSGFIANPRARKLICPDCKDVTCQSCRMEWAAEHENMSCEDFSKWKNEHELEAVGVNKHLEEHGINCPKCKFKFSLAKGGCMHFTCSQCKYEFCSGCSQPFRQGKKCAVGPYCERLGLHAHHPRNCLFYLRDKEPLQLQTLLKEKNITFNIDVPDGYSVLKAEGGWNKCQVLEQKELPEGLMDDMCGRIVTDGFAGFCRLHYTEYLVEIINEQKLDPVNIFDEADLRVCLRRNGKTVPIRRWESEKLYRDKLIKLIKEQLPLDV